MQKQILVVVAHNLISVRSSHMPLIPALKGNMKWEETGSGFSLQPCSALVEVKTSPRLSSFAFLIFILIPNICLWVCFFYHLCYSTPQQSKERVLSLAEDPGSVPSACVNNKPFVVQL